MRAPAHRPVVLVFAAPAQAWIPNDPGTSGQPGGWQSDQWNFLPGTGVDAPRAWDNLIAAGRPGGEGVKIAVLDTGVAYENHGALPRSPDLSRSASPRATTSARTPAAAATRAPARTPTRRRLRPRHARREHDRRDARTTAKGLTGLAYGATIIPVKVLNRNGDGDEESIAKGLRYAADQGAQVINLSFEFGTSIDVGRRRSRRSPPRSGTRAARAR